MGLIGIARHLPVWREESPDREKIEGVNHEKARKDTKKEGGRSQMFGGTWSVGPWRSRAFHCLRSVA